METSLKETRRRIREQGAMNDFLVGRMRGRLFTQKELAFILGVSSGALSQKMENGVLWFKPWGIGISGKKVGKEWLFSIDDISKILKLKISKEMT